MSDLAAALADKESKSCTKCGAVKLLSEFWGDRSKKSGYRAWCKKCSYDAKLRLPRNENYILPDKKVCADCRRCLAISEFYIRGPNTKPRHQANTPLPYCKKCNTIRHKRWREKYTKNWRASWFSGLKAEAKKRNIPFSITTEDIKIPSKCPVLGIPIVFGADRQGVLFKSAGDRRDQCPSLDRIDNTKGYVPGNVVVVSYRANRLKSDASLEELTKIAAFYRRFQK